MSTDVFTLDTSELTAAVAVLDAAAFDALADQVAAPAMVDLGRAIQGNIRQAAEPHRRTGAMAAAVVAQAHPAGIRTLVDVTAGPPANLVVGGTRPHEIRPLHRHALQLGEGAASFASRVRHPGTRPDPFVARGIAASEPDVTKTLDRAGAELVGRMAHELGGS